MQSMQMKFHEEVNNLGLHVHGLAHAASGYQRVLEENHKLCNQVQDLKGQRNCAVGATALNDFSSRSHSCLTVLVQGRDLTSGTVLHGCMHLVDVAGSVRVDKSEVTGDRLKEAKTLMFVHISPKLHAIGETVSTFKFAERVATVELGAARINKDGVDVKELEEQSYGNFNEGRTGIRTFAAYDIRQSMQHVVVPISI